MNRKLIGTLIVGSLLVTACGAATTSPAAPNDTRTHQEEAVPGGGATPTAADPAMAPAAAPAPAPAPAEAKKTVVVHE